MNEYRKKVLWEGLGDICVMILFTTQVFFGASFGEKLAVADGQYPIYATIIGMDVFISAILIWLILKIPHTSKLMRERTRKDRFIGMIILIGILAPFFFCGIPGGYAHAIGQEMSALSLIACGLFACAMTLAVLTIGTIWMKKFEIKPEKEYMDDPSLAFAQYLFDKEI